MGKRFRQNLRPLPSDLPFGDTGSVSRVLTDVRSRSVAVVDGGMARRAAAERFGVSAASATRWVQAWRAIGLTRAKPQGDDMQ